MVQSIGGMCASVIGILTFLFVATVSSFEIGIFSGVGVFIGILGVLALINELRNTATIKADKHGKENYAFTCPTCNTKIKIGQESCPNCGKKI